MFPKKRITKVQIRLRENVDWSVRLLFTCNKFSFSIATWPIFNPISALCTLHFHNSIHVSSFDNSLDPDQLV